jgi:DNA-3-methyladenine glycosylase
MIVETEAYTARGDEASHTFSRPSTRAFVKRYDAGTAYVYFNYGMYWLFNVLVKGGAEDGFVLIRALQPTRGLAAMSRRRFPGDSRDGATALRREESLCSGPGKLTIALGISGVHHGVDLCVNPKRAFHAVDGHGIESLSDVRIGITKSAHLPWRFLAAENRFVSVPVRPPPHRPGKSAARSPGERRG